MDCDEAMIGTMRIDVVLGIVGMNESRYNSDIQMLQRKT